MTVDTLGADVLEGDWLIAWFLTFVASGSGSDVVGDFVRQTPRVKTRDIGISHDCSRGFVRQ